MPVTFFSWPGVYILFTCTAYLVVDNKTTLETLAFEIFFALYMLSNIPLSRIYVSFFVFLDISCYDTDRK